MKKYVERTYPNGTCKMMYFNGNGTSLQISWNINSKEEHRLIQVTTENHYFCRDLNMLNKTDNKYYSHVLKSLFNAYWYEMF